MSDIIEELAQFSLDPYGFVLFAFPWGEEGGELEGKTGPEPWQRDFLIALGKELEAGLSPDLAIVQSVQFARTSGHGVGKSALVSWIIWWAISTFEDTRGVVTANTEVQLKTKTWVEVATWYRRFIGRELFKMTATSIFSNDPDHEKTWRIDMVPWSERNPEAFAGLHNLNKRILVVFDEASAIPDIIWETTEGALTDKNTQIIWAVFGNPTKNKGRFRECFPGGRFAHRWRSDVVDSRTVSFTNKIQHQQWIDDYGEDHDFVRVRVRGIFPRVDAESFISLDVVREASKRTIEIQYGFPTLIGVDVGRFGDDPAVIFPRRGRDARSLPVEIYPGIDTMTLCRHIANAVARHHAAFVFIDEGGVGGGVVDRCRQMQLPVVAVDFGSKADGTNSYERGVKYANKRAEIWGEMRDWLPTAAIPDSVSGFSLLDELTGPNYGMNQREEILLESKKDMRRRGVPSPNMADALATTFAFPVFEPSTVEITKLEPIVMPDYDPYDRERTVA